MIKPAPLIGNAKGSEILDNFGPYCSICGLKFEWERRRLHKLYAIKHTKDWSIYFEFVCSRCNYSTVGGYNTSIDPTIEFFPSVNLYGEYGEEK